MSDTQKPSVKDMHDVAMDFAEEAKYHLDKAIDYYSRAAHWERQALDRVREKPNNEPTLSTMEISYRSLVMLSEGRIAEAKALAEGVDLGRKTS